MLKLRNNSILLYSEINKTHLIKELYYIESSQIHIKPTVHGSINSFRYARISRIYILKGVSRGVKLVQISSLSWQVRIILLEWARLENPFTLIKLQIPLPCVYINVCRNQITTTSSKAQKTIHLQDIINCPRGKLYKLLVLLSPVCCLKPRLYKQTTFSFLQDYVSILFGYESQS